MTSQPLKQSLLDRRSTLENEFKELDQTKLGHERLISQAKAAIEKIEIRQYQLQGGFQVLTAQIEELEKAEAKNPEEGNPPANQTNPAGNAPATGGSSDEPK